MQFIVADLEWNGAYSRKAHGYFNEIIEIGAVKLNEAMELTSRFHALIKPVVSRKLSEVVTGLTSITAEELDEGGTFQTAVSRLRKWIGGEDAVFLTWSTTDLLVLMENCRYFFGSDRIPFLDRYADLQKYCQLRIEADTSQQMGLSKACERLGISEEDMALHRALDDSVLTGQVLQKVYDPASFAEQMAVVDDAFYDRITFKNVILSDIDSPSSSAASCSSTARTADEISSGWVTGSSATGRSTPTSSAAAAGGNTPAGRSSSCATRAWRSSGG